MTLSENFIKNQRYLDSFGEMNIAVDVFNKEMNIIYNGLNPSGRITTEKQKQVSELVVKDNFFVCWCKEKTLPDSLWLQDDETIKTTTKTFEIPTTEIKDILFKKLKDLNMDTNKTDTLLNFLLDFKAKDHWINEYYGESVMLRYIYIANDDLISITL